MNGLTGAVRRIESTEIECACAVICAQGHTNVSAHRTAQTIDKLWMRRGDVFDSHIQGLQFRQPTQQCLLLRFHPQT